MAIAIYKFASCEEMRIVANNMGVRFCNNIINMVLKTTIDFFLFAHMGIKVISLSNNLTAFPPNAYFCGFIRFRNRTSVIFYYDSLALKFADFVNRVFRPALRKLYGRKLH